MRELIKTAEPKSVIICPTTDDGVASSVILNRRFGASAKTLYFSENSLAAAFDYPSIRSSASPVRIIVAGFPHQPAMEIEKTPVGEHLWFSHHYWPGDALRRFQGGNWRLFNDPSQATTSNLLIHHYGIEDAVSRQCAEFLAHLELPAKEDIAAWRNMSLAARANPIGIRKTMLPLFDPKMAMFPPPDPLIHEEGKVLFQNLEAMISDGNRPIFETKLSPGRCVVLGLPPSLIPYYRSMASLSFRRLDCRSAILFFDGEDQIILTLSLSARERIAIEWAEMIDRIIGKAIARLFDQGMVVISERNLNVISIVESLIRAL